MTVRREPTIRYRLPLVDGQPEIGAILMGDGPRVRAPIASCPPPEPGAASLAWAFAPGN